MNRELKFRVWDKETSAWCNWSNANSFFHCDGSGSVSWYRNESRFIIQQYTGLKDKNGREIYEGDFIKLTDSPYIYSIEWHDYQWCINDNYVLGYDDCYQPLNICVYERCEIVGNIFENTELLK